MACSNSADKRIEKEISHSKQMQHKSCCENHSESEKDSKSCSNSCEQACCTCSATSAASAFTIVSELSFKNVDSHFFEHKDSRFSYVSKAISDGFLSIWLIPKIG